MGHYQPLNALVIHGGRNDRTLDSSAREGSFNDVALLYLETLQWITVITSGFERNARFSHCAAIFGTKIIIFGGMSFSSYMDSTIEIAELDQSAVAVLQQEEKRRDSHFGSGNTQKPMAIDSILSRKLVRQPSAGKKETISKQYVSYLPMPTKEQLKVRTEQIREDTDDEPTKKAHPQEAYVTSIKNFMRVANRKLTGTNSRFEHS